MDPRVTLIAILAALYFVSASPRPCAVREPETAAFGCGLCGSDRPHGGHPHGALLRVGNSGRTLACGRAHGCGPQHRAHGCGPQHRDHGCGPQHRAHGCGPQHM